MRYARSNYRRHCRVAFLINKHRSKDFDLFEVFGFDYEDNEEEVEASEIDEL